MLSSCMNGVTHNNFTCNQNWSGFSYPYDEFRSLDEGSKTTFSDPGWTPLLDQFYEISNSPVFDDDKNSIWLIGEKLYKYQISSRKIKQYQIDWEGRKYSPSNVVKGEDGGIYGIGFQQEGTLPVISKYIPDQDTFNPIIDTERTLVMSAVNINGDLVIDNSGNIWISTNQNQIIKYDPSNNSSKIIYDAKTKKGRLDKNLEIDSSGNIWAMVRIENIYGFILKIDQTEYELQELSIPPEYPMPASGIMIDKNGRLWVSDYAYWDVNSPFPKEGYEGWSKVIRSPVFITPHKVWKEYEWDRPTPIFEDNEGNLWFNSFGLVKFDLEKSEWCRILDYKYPRLGFAQSFDGKYWLVTDGMLYRYN